MNSIDNIINFVGCVVCAFVSCVIVIGLFSLPFLLREIVDKLDTIIYLMVNGRDSE